MPSKSKISRSVMLGNGVITLLLMATPIWAASSSPSTEGYDDWFHSRFVWAPVFGALLGLLAGWAHFGRLKYPPDALDVNSLARRGLLRWLGGLALATLAFLLLDLWNNVYAEQPSLFDVMSRDWLRYETLVITVLALGGFIVTLALYTRFKPHCPCRYAFWPAKREL